MTKTASVLDKKIARFHKTLAQSTLNRCDNANITTFGDIIKHTYNKLLFAGLSSHNIKELKVLLEKYGVNASCLTRK